MATAFTKTTRRAAIFFKPFVLTASVLFICVAGLLSFAQDVPESADSYSSGQDKYRSGDYVGAASDFERFIAESPESPKRNQTELYLGASYLARGGYQDRAEFARAQQCFNYVLSQGEKAPFYREAFFHSCRISYKSRAYRQALVLLQEFIRLYPNDPFSGYAYYYAGDCARRLGETDAAVSFFDAGSRFNDSPFCWDCVVRRAELFVSSGRYIEADQEIKKLETNMNVPPSASYETPRLRSKFFLAQGRYDEAIAYLESYSKSSIVQSDDELRAVLSLSEAQARYFKGDFVGAESCVKRCEESKSPVLAGAGLLKIKLELEGDRVDEAEKTLELLEKSEFGANNRDVINVTRASVKLAQRKYDEVIDLLIQTLKVRSDVGARVLFQYYDARKSDELEPNEFVDACETLIFAFIQRAREQKDADALQSQEAVFQATLNYATTLGDPSVARNVVRIERKRRQALDELKNVDFGVPTEKTSSLNGADPIANGVSPTPLDSVVPNVAKEPAQAEAPQKGETKGETNSSETNVTPQAEALKDEKENATSEETTNESSASTVDPKNGK